VKKLSRSRIAEDDSACLLKSMRSLRSPGLPLRTAITAALLLGASLFAAPEKWAAEINKYTQADAIKAPARDAVVFVGSSSIRKWTSLATDFPGITTINRGFGGSELSDSVFYADRIVIPYAPRLVVVYAGENDLQAGKSAEALLADFQAFCAKIHPALPKTKIIFLAVKESPSRAKIRDKVLLANQLIAAACAQDPRRTFVDVATPMLDAAGKTRPELFIADQLHLQPAGYAIWTQVLAPYLKP
jgi:lysophospholipase L1-like esterase